jgi:hypothetical protein
MEENVLGFQVPVHYIEFDHALHPLYYLPHQLHCLLFLQAPLTLDKLFQSPSVAVLVNQIHVVLSLNQLDEFNHVRVIYFLQRLYFVYCEFFQSRILVEYLICYLFIIIQLASLRKIGLFKCFPPCKLFHTHLSRGCSKVCNCELAYSLILKSKFGLKNF